MLMKRTTLSARLLGRSALTMATGMPTSQDSTTESRAISAVSGPRRRIISATLSERKNDRPKLPRRMSLDPAQVLHHSGIAQAELRHVAGALFLGELGQALRAEDRDQWIAGQDAHHHEDDDRYADHGKRAERKPARNVAVQGASLSGLHGPLLGGIIGPVRGRRRLLLTPDVAQLAWATPLSRHSAATSARSRSEAAMPTTTKSGLAGGPISTPT